MVKDSKIKKVMGVIMKNASKIILQLFVLGNTFFSGAMGMSRENEQTTTSRQQFLEERKITLKKLLEKLYQAMQDDIDGVFCFNFSPIRDCFAGLNGKETFELHQVSYCGLTTLASLVLRNNPQDAAKLLQKISQSQKCTLLKLSDYQGTALHIAVSRNNLAFVRLLLAELGSQQKCDLLAIRDGENSTVLHAALRNNDSSILTFILDGIGAEQAAYLLSLKGYMEWLSNETVLQCALHKRSCETIKALLEPLVAMVRHGDLYYAAKLLEILHMSDAEGNDAIVLAQKEAKNETAAYLQELEKRAQEIVTRWNKSRYNHEVFKSLEQNNKIDTTFKFV